MRKRIVIIVGAAALFSAACAEQRGEETSVTIPTVAATATPTATSKSCPGAIPWDQAYGYVGDGITIEGPVVGTSYASGIRGRPMFLNIGKPYPDPDRFTVVIWGDKRGNFPFAPEVEYENKTICVTGLIETYKGSPQIIADTPSDIEIVE